MSTLDRSDLLAIAGLARLDLEDGDVDRLLGELGAILDHMAALAAVDTEGVPPMTHAVPTPMRLRDDAARPSLPVAEALAGAPDRDGDAFRVPAAVRPDGEAR
jgi:aspartyl-tRNA(Asn)/glutamyl-tRNA(Gln) amidotransferase subunit C